jgi:hypothetical protein
LLSQDRRWFELLGVSANNQATEDPVDRGVGCSYDMNSITLLLECDKYVVYVLFSKADNRIACKPAGTESHCIT